jgi:hypothetical protein
MLIAAKPTIKIVRIVMSPSTLPCLIAIAPDAILSSTPSRAVLPETLCFFGRLAIARIIATNLGFSTLPSFICRSFICISFNVLLRTSSAELGFFRTCNLLNEGLFRRTKANAPAGFLRRNAASYRERHPSRSVGCCNAVSRLRVRQPCHGLPAGLRAHSVQIPAAATPTWSGALAHA